MANNLRDRRTTRLDSFTSDEFAASIRPVLLFCKFGFQAAVFFVLIVVGCVVLYAVTCDMGD